MKTFQDALAFVLKWEGGYVNDPDDRGGATNCGVTQSVYDAYRNSQNLGRRPVKDINRDEVADIYRMRYWRASRAEWLPWPLSLAVFDIAVNSGVGRSTQFLNRIFGLGTSMEWTVALSAKIHKANAKETALQLCRERERFYRRLAVLRPVNRKFLKGWLRRNDALRKEIEAA
jgi:lysozyme family protein